MKFETILEAYDKVIIKNMWPRSDKERRRGRRQRAAFRARLELMYEKAYYHGVNVGLEVADPELYGEDHVALP